jgi:hypothetical protein
VATTILYPRNVESNQAGFNWLASVASTLLTIEKEQVTFDARHLRFFDANLCAPFGALLHGARNRGNTIEVGEVRGKVLEIWSKNLFMERFGGVPMNDTFRTTLAYRQFSLTQDAREFADYIQHELMARDRDLPQMSDEMRREFATSIEEIFDNALAHSNSTGGIFGCGQFFPAADRLAFTLTDLGVGFRHNVEKRMGIACSDEAAIEWATQTGHTTRARDGGYGLSSLRQFFARNNGRMQIVSQRGLWELNGSSTRKATLRHPFPGSFVNLEINTNDNTYHESLATQLNEPLF